MAENVTVLALRFICGLLMHLQVEGDIRQGLRMMKYVVNHREEFSAPFNAFLVGFLQVFTGLATEICTYLFLATINVEIDVIINYMAVTVVSMVDNIYLESMPAGNRVKNECEPLKIINHKRDLQVRIAKEGSSCNFRVMRTIFKATRMFYSCFVFYFFPYTSLIIPYIAKLLRKISNQDLEEI